MDSHSPPDSAAKTARVVLTAFVLTFAVARILVLLIMSRRLPDLFVHVGQTHVHHLNYGIFLLTAVGAWLLFARPSGKHLSAAAAMYGVGLALTFDEFGMWLHLGGSYWQRASYDAIVTIAATLALIAVAPKLQHLRPRQWFALAGMVVTITCLGILMAEGLQRYGPALHEMEQRGPR